MMRALGLVVSLAASSASAGFIYGVGGHAAFSTQSLYRIDTSTGAASLVGSTGLVQIADIAWNSGTGTMFALTISGDLYTLSLQTGASTLVSATSNTLPEGSLTYFGGEFYSNDTKRLVNVDGSTAALTPIGDMGSAASDVSGLVFDSSGAMWAYSKNGSLADTLLSVDPLTGAATTVGAIGATGTSAVGGLAFDTGTLYLTDGNGLYAVNTGTGAGSFIGSHGVGGFSGIAIPAPGAACLLTVAALSSLRRRR
jgi:hypothetical protein